MMTIFEPLFILLFLATVVTLSTATVAALRGQQPRALRILRRLAIGTVFYFAVVLIVAAAAVPPLHRVGETICFDDWCFAVADAKQAPSGSAQRWNVTMRISNRAGRVTMGERYVVVYLTDSRHRRFDPDPASATVPLDSRMEPGHSLDITRTFDLPADAKDVSLVFTHEGGFPIGSLIIGENELFHNATVIKFE
jgi:hypothetical protein